MTLNEFQTLVRKSKQNFENDPDKIIVSNPVTSGLDIQFVVSSPPSGAQAALDAVAMYIESLFSDPITLSINVNFQSLEPGILGSTVSYVIESSWTNTRNGLINGMDIDDTIQPYLPAGSTIPVRYDISSGTVTNENRCIFTKANYRATIGSVSGTVADITINSNYNWDYNPNNGIPYGYYCFQSVLAHEVGHVLGFISYNDPQITDILALDCYRFQRSDGSGNYNPDTLTEFQTTARLAWKDASGSSTDDCNSDLISVEYRMSDGYPYQASHFSQGNVN
jgi:hypothetical protein